MYENMLVIDLYYLHGGSGCLEGGKHHTRIIYQMSVTLTITAINILYLHRTLYTLTLASGQLYTTLLSPVRPFKYF